MSGRRVLELLGLAMIGEGLMTTLRPRRYMRLWDCGPKWLRATVTACAQHPKTMRSIGVIEMIAGIYIALRQTDG